MNSSVKRRPRLLRQASKLASQHKKLAWLPFFSTAITLVIMGVILRPIIRAHELNELLHAHHLNQILLIYLWLYLFIFTIEQITQYFSAAFIACAQQIFQKKTVSLFIGFKIASARFLALFGWMSFALTAGLFIRLFRMLLRFLPFYKKSLQELKWPIATYFILPCIIIDQMGPIKSMKQSALLMRNNWGKDLNPNFGVSPWLVLGRLFAIVPLLVGFIIGGHQNIIIGLIITITLTVITTTLASLTHLLLCVALFRFASEGIVEAPFEEAQIKKAFKHSQ